MSPQLSPPVRPELDDIADRLLALRRLASEADDFLLYLVDLAVLHVAHLGAAGGVAADEVPGLEEAQ